MALVLVPKRTRNYLELSWKSTTYVGRKEEGRRNKYAGSTSLLILISIGAMGIHG
jgi:hypothetical protein